MASATVIYGPCPAHSGQILGRCKICYDIAKVAVDDFLKQHEMVCSSHLASKCQYCKDALGSAVQLATSKKARNPSVPVPDINKLSEIFFSRPENIPYEKQTTLDRKEEELAELKFAKYLTK